MDDIFFFFQWRKQDFIIYTLEEVWEFVMLRSLDCNPELPTDGHLLYLNSPLNTETHRGNQDLLTQF